mmetsp:Transcript_155061/g.497111  ORF Transcript_155061/g.497111 Transcript_155061/m.497111 type:complete len:255 (+) Transcript_155061:834-1598(+)
MAYLGGAALRAASDTLHHGICPLGHGLVVVGEGRRPRGGESWRIWLALAMVADTGLALAALGTIPAATIAPVVAQLMARAVALGRRVAASSGEGAVVGQRREVPRSLRSSLGLEACLCRCPWCRTSWRPVADTFNASLGAASLALKRQQWSEARPRSAKGGVGVGHRRRAQRLWRLGGTGGRRSSLGRCGACSARECAAVRGSGPAAAFSFSRRPHLARRARRDLPLRRHRACFCRAFDRARAPRAVRVSAAQG